MLIVPKQLFWVLKQWAKNPLHKRCKGEGKSYTTGWSNKWQLSNQGIEPTTASIGTRFELGEPVLAVRARTALPIGYLRIYRFKLFTNVIREGVLQKSTWGSLRSHLRANRARKQKIVRKRCNGQAGAWTCYLEGARQRQVRCSASPIGLRICHIYTALTPKLLLTDQN